MLLLLCFLTLLLLPPVVTLERVFDPVSKDVAREDSPGKYFLLAETFVPL